MATLAKNNEDLGTAKEDLQPTFVADDVIQAPTVPGSAVARSISPFVTLAVVLSFAVLLVLVVLRDSAQKRREQPEPHPRSPRSPALGALLEEVLIRPTAVAGGCSVPT